MNYHYCNNEPVVYYQAGTYWARASAAGLFTNGGIWRDSHSDDRGSPSYYN